MTHLKHRKELSPEQEEVILLFRKSDKIDVGTFRRFGLGRVAGVLGSQTAFHPMFNYTDRDPKNYTAKTATITDEGRKWRNILLEQGR